jgi:hypothetical protein
MQLEVKTWTSDRPRHPAKLQRDSESLSLNAQARHLTKNGEGDLSSWTSVLPAREKMLELRERLLAVEEDRQAGQHGCSVDELDSYLSEVIGSMKKT